MTGSAHGAGTTVLLVTPYTPRRDARHGSGRVVHGLADALADRTRLVLVHPRADGPPSSDIADRCVDAVAFGPARPVEGVRRARDAWALLRGRNLRTAAVDRAGLRSAVRGALAAHRPDVVQVEGIDLGDALGDAMGSVDGAGARVLSIYDPAVRAKEQLDAAPPGRRVVQRADAWASVRQERRAVRASDGVVVFTESDAASLPRVGTPVRAIRPGVRVPSRAADPVGSSPPTVLFVGNFVHPPNVDAAERLSCRIAPHIWDRHPEVRIRIVGPMPPPRVTALAGDRVAVVGEVPDLAPELDAAAVVVAPLSLGGGIRIKVLDAMAAGKAVVASPLAAAGLATAGDAIVVADDDEDFADAVAALVADVDTRRHVAQAARAWVNEHATWSHSIEELLAFHRELVGR